FGLREIDAEDASGGIQMDAIAVLEQADRAADRRFRADVADAKAAGGAGEAAVGDERDLVAHALAVDGGRGGQHLTQPRTAAWALVADDDDIAGFVLAAAHRPVGVLLAIEAAGASGENEVLHPRDLHNRTLRRQVALETDDAAGRRDRVFGRAHDILIFRE